MRRQMKIQRGFVNKFLSTLGTNMFSFSMDFEMRIQSRFISKCFPTSMTTETSLTTMLNFVVILHTSDIVALVITFGTFEMLLWITKMICLPFFFKGIKELPTLIANIFRLP
uniref:Uncharacterized protein n=1 Tax=Lepeophtheirus salmonis TaxID=72036 RepID=A0A0K2TQH0_LEPSM